MGDVSLVLLLRTWTANASPTPAADAHAMVVAAEAIIHRTLHHWAGGLVLRRGLLEDVAQEALLRVWINRRRCRADTDAGVAAWIATITRCTAIDLLRSDWRVPTISIDVECAWNPPADTLGEAPRGAALLAELSWTLGETDAEVLWHRLVSNQEWSEIGQALGISWTAARRRYQRAITRLRALATADPRLIQLLATTTHPRKAPDRDSDG
ncbi:MAG: RNA polymerase sigma factor [Gemmatimonadaceae bacterium]|jgi:RNA polymerase sigma factor (sigma-70 family)